ncbi:hypothetical protein ACJRO7_026428 [Eucalyptus globulus]|uniref:Aldose 1-epimerase n=1 Tax=Eucalyptus globulus TaxID=34317 RepID=A0ABD3JNC5_EUCGL
MAKTNFYIVFLVELLLAFQASEASKEVGIYEPKRGNFSVKLTNYGATMLSLILPGNLVDIVLGYDTIDNDVIWTMKSYSEENHVTFGYESYDREQAKALNKATPVNLALHTYWNLGGHNSGDILSHTIQDHSKLLYNFLQPRHIGSRINELPHGYDINYVLDDREHRHLNKVADVKYSKTGRKMELWSNQPGVQFYTANYLEIEKGKGGFTLNNPNFPSQIISPRQTYKHIMVFQFTAK